MTIPQLTPELIGFFLVLGLHMCAVLTGLGAFPAAWTSEVLAGARKKIFLKKLAQQISMLGVMFLWYMIIAVGGSFAVFHYQYPELLKPWLANPLIGVPAVSALLWTLLFGMVYALTWKSSKKNAGRHKTLGFLAALGLPLILGLSLAVKLGPIWDLPAGVNPKALAQTLLAGAMHPFYPTMLAGTILLALACASGFGLVWLIIRRKRDDFGRDYYNFVIRHTAKWAAVTVLATLAVQTWQCYQMLPQVIKTPAFPMLSYIAGTGGIAAFIASLLWTVVNRSSTPLRFKPMIIIAAILLVTTVTAFSVINASVFIKL